MAIDPIWLAAGRTFPVTVDPYAWFNSTTLSGDNPFGQSNTSEDDFISSATPCGGAYSSNSELWVVSPGPGSPAEGCPDPLYPYQYFSSGYYSRSRTLAMFALDNMQTAPWAGHYNVISATLGLWNWGGGSGQTEYDVYGLAAPPSTATAWNNQPGLDTAWPYTTAGTPPAPYGLQNGYMTFDVGSLANRWLNQGETNNGMEVRANNLASGYHGLQYGEYDNSGNGWRRFYAGEVNNNSYVPYLYLVYQAPPDGTSVTATGQADSANLAFPVPYENGAPQTSYNIVAHDTVYNTYTTLTCTTCDFTQGTNATYTFGGLSPGHSYNFTVTGVNSQGPGQTSPYSNTVVITSALSMTKTLVAVGAAGATCGSPASGSTFSRGAQIGYCLTLTNVSANTLSTVSVTDNMANTGLLALSGSPMSLDTGACASCAIVSNTFTATLTLAPGTTHTLGFIAQAIGSDRACSTATNVANASQGLDSASASVSAVVCDTGLGLENWWSYVSRDLGGGASARVNVANGNLVVQQSDTTPVQAHGHLDYVLRRTYNSQDTTLLNLPGSIGKGWMFNVSQAGDTVGDGVGATSLYVPPLEQSSANTASLAVTLIDRDGTHHVFTPKGLIASGAVDVTTAAGALGTLVPRVLAAASGSKLCVDETYQAPPGVHLGLWRYVQISATSSCSAVGQSGGPPTTLVGFAAERPDRLRTEFYADGHVLDTLDANGVELQYAYTAPPVGPAVVLGPLQYIFEPRGTQLGWPGCVL